MTNNIEVQPAGISESSDIKSLLQDAKLPVEDLPETLDNFFIATGNNTIVGAIGLEQYGSCGLLRSLIVAPPYRNLSVAASLIAALEQKAVNLDIDWLYLLTETAPLYFEKKGFQKIARDEVPLAVQQSSEFSHVCPSSAIAMKKQLK